MTHSFSNRLRKSFVALTLFTLIGFSLPLANDKQFIAVMDMEFPDGDGRALSDKLVSEIVHIGTYGVVERARIAEILKEQGFQNTGCTDQSCAVQIGQLIGAQAIVTGRIGKIEDNFSLSLKLINVATGELERTVTIDDNSSVEDLYQKAIVKAAIEICRHVETWEKLGISASEYSLLQNKKIPDTLINKQPWVSCQMNVETWVNLYAHSIACQDYTLLLDAGIKHDLIMTKPWEKNNVSPLEWKSNYVNQRHKNVKHVLTMTFGGLTLCSGVACAILYWRGTSLYAEYKSAGRATATSLGNAYQNAFQGATITGIAAGLFLTTTVITYAF